MLYRLFTKRKNVKNLLQLVSEHFGGFTVFETLGYWQGKKEKSLCVEIVSNEVDDVYHIHTLCRQICGYNHQDCVLVQTINVDSNLHYVSYIEQLK